MTPDGISASDWDRVHDLALEIVNAEHPDEDARARRDLLEYLDHLESRYGVLPSILATRADYIDDPESAEQLLRRAYELAAARGDGRNALYAASSLATHYSRERPDPDQAKHWLSIARIHLADVGDDTDRRECDRIQKMLDAM